MAQTHTLDRHKGELDRAPRDFKSNSTQIALNRNSQDFSERTYFKKSILFPKWWGLSWVGVTYGNRLGKLLTARKDRLSMYRLFASIVFYENKTKLWAHDVIGYSCLHVFHKRCQRQMRFFSLVLSIMYRRFHSKPQKCFRYWELLLFTFRQLWHRHRNKKCNGYVRGVCQQNCYFQIW